MKWLRFLAISVVLALDDDDEGEVDRLNFQIGSTDIHFAVHGGRSDFSLRLRGRGNCVIVDIALL